MSFLTTRVEIAGAAALYGLTYEIADVEGLPDMASITFRRGARFAQCPVPKAMLDDTDVGAGLYLVVKASEQIAKVGA